MSELFQDKKELAGVRGRGAGRRALQESKQPSRRAADPVAGPEILGPGQDGTRMLAHMLGLAVAAHAAWWSSVFIHEATDC